MSRRTEMLGSTIQRELGEIILHELDDPRLPGIVSVTRVNVAPDLSQADVYVSVMGSAGQEIAAINALRHSAGMIRSRLTRALSLRQSPFLKFHIDENLKKEISLYDVLRKIDRERQESQAANADSAATGDNPSDE